MLPYAVTGCFTFLPRWRSFLEKGEVDDPSFACSFCSVSACAVGRLLRACFTRRSAAGACPSGRSARSCPKQYGCRRLSLLMPFQVKDATGAQPVGRPATGLLRLEGCEDRSRLQHDQGEFL